MSTTVIGLFAVPCVLDVFLRIDTLFHTLSLIVVVEHEYFVCVFSSKTVVWVLL